MHGMCHEAMEDELVLATGTRAAHAPHAGPARCCPDHRREHLSVGRVQRPRESDETGVHTAHSIQRTLCDVSADEETTCGIVKS